MANLLGVIESLNSTVSALSADLTSRSSKEHSADSGNNNSSSNASSNNNNVGNKARK